jgi:hypothetical protein
VVASELKKTKKGQKVGNQSMSDQFALVHSWWDEIDPKGLGYVQRQAFDGFAKKKSIVASENEVDALLRQMIGETVPLTGQIKKS